MLSAAPKWERYKPDRGDEIFWSGEEQVPAVGTRVRIILNGWTKDGKGDRGNICGDVEGYEIVAGWLMVYVRPDTRPEWHKREMPTRHVCLFAGCELEALHG